MSECPTILLLPGNMCDERMWHQTLPAFAGWKVEHYLPQEGSIPDMARACLNRFQGPLLPIGFSMGAIVAAAIADIAPLRIAALGLIDTNTGPDRPERASARGRQQRDVRDGALADVVMEELKPAYFAKQNRSNKQLRALVLDMAVTVGDETFVSQSEALRTRPDYCHVLQNIEAPIFLACGEEDDLCTPELHKQMASHARNVELHIIPGAGHMLPLEQPEKLRTVLSAWLTRLKEDSPCLIAS